MLRRCLAALAVMAFPLGALAADPKVPPAQDPGLIPVALLGAGVDYTDMAIAQRLARDGEGNIVGWDFVDNDLFPFSKDAASNAHAKLLLTNAGIELVPVRIGEGDRLAAGGAASFLSHTAVRIVVVPMTTTKAQDWVIFTKAAQIFTTLLFVVPAGDAEPLFPAASDLPNVLSVAAPLAKSELANVAMAPGGSDPGSAIDAAITLAAALATCHAPVIAGLSGNAMKMEIMAKLAKPRSASRVPAIEPCP